MNTKPSWLNLDEHPILLTHSTVHDESNLRDSLVEPKFSKSDWCWISNEVLRQSTTNVEISKSFVHYHSLALLDADIEKRWKNVRLEQVQLLWEAYDAGRQVGDGRRRQRESHLDRSYRVTQKRQKAGLQKGYLTATFVACLGVFSALALALSFVGMVTGGKAFTGLGLFSALAASVFFIWFEEKAK